MVKQINSQRRIWNCIASDFFTEYFFTYGLYYYSFFIAMNSILLVFITLIADGCGYVLIIRALVQAVKTEIHSNTTKALNRTSLNLILSLPYT